jgi:hypothetical protein
VTAQGHPRAYAEHDPIKFERAALRWLARYATEGKAISLLKTQLALWRSRSFERAAERLRQLS